MVLVAPVLVTADNTPYAVCAFAFAPVLDTLSRVLELAFVPVVELEESESNVPLVSPASDNANAVPVVTPSKLKVLVLAPCASMSGLEGLIIWSHLGAEPWT